MLCCKTIRTQLFTKKLDHMKVFFIFKAPENLVMNLKYFCARLNI